MKSQTTLKSMLLLEIKSMLWQHDGDNNRSVVDGKFVKLDEKKDVVILKYDNSKGELSSLRF